MSFRSKRALLAAILLAGVAMTAPALAADRAPTANRVEDAWCRAPPPGAPTAAGYVTVRNLGPAPDRLTGGSSPVAAQVELHSMTTQGGVMRMRPVTGGLAIAAHGVAVIQPGSDLHLMLIGLKRRLKVGEHVPVTLRFARAGRIRADFIVRDQGAAAQAMPLGRHEHMDHIDHLGGR